ncbi:hypothetical protein E2C01_004046 [Portunus trituberculatus]|uniref:Uncharacterized protein n=1 Tax=Portunus trituberculatus TaxID=210409 RepID=A0A5B7CVB0_PORTR|nr:hypothetical protein [Portunus trituberculatus]
MITYNTDCCSFCVEEKQVQLHLVLLEGKLKAVRLLAKLCYEFESSLLKLCDDGRLVIFNEDAKVNVLAPGDDVTLSVEPWRKTTTQKCSLQEGKSGPEQENN